MNTKVYLFLISKCLIVLFACSSVWGQNQFIADSLKKVIHSRTTVDSVYLEDLENIAYNEQDPTIAEAYADSLLHLSSELKLPEHQISGYLQKGNADFLQGHTSEALNSYFKATEIALGIKQSHKAAAIYGSIADVYSLSKDYRNSTKYYGLSIRMLREGRDTVSLGTALLNAGDNYNKQEKYDSALVLLREANKLFNDLRFDQGIAYVIGNMGMAYKGLDSIHLSEQHFRNAITSLELLEDYYPVCVYLLELSKIEHDRDQHKSALQLAHRSLNIAKELGLTEQLSAAHLQLDDLYAHIGDFKKAYQHFKEHIYYKDKMENLEMIRERAEERVDHNIRQKQLEVDLLEQQKANQKITIVASIVTLVLSVLLALGIYRRYRFTQESKRIIEDEKQKSDNLLLNILPEETAHELKTSGKVAAQRFDSVTILFTDFEGFTRYAENLSPEELVKSVDFYFSKFDEIIAKYDLEKIKTVGDAYMVAAGLPYPTHDHAIKMTHAALDIADFVAKTKTEGLSQHTTFDVRIGINTGPVVAGVVGTRKFAYDIWGDAVNIASRMESNSLPGRVNVSESTYKWIQEEFECEFRGELEVKNKGMMKMYFVNRKF